MSASRLTERLLELPLFQGMSRNDLKEVTETAKFHQFSYTKGKIVVSEGEVCDKLYFLLKGTLSLTGYSDDRAYSITERISAPDILQPERIFGLIQRYTKTFKTLEDCIFICLSKQETMKLSDDYEIFRLNLLNIICTQSQRLTRFPLRVKPVGIRNKIVRFMENRCLSPAGEKTLHIKMERLASEIGESRLNLSRELNAMNEEGIIELRRGEIHIYALEKLTV
ncbi:MAG: Crp/Fnr family transcriptional regulator [Prevotellaceae bacterium]|nr:Crp/Fnr family transcriptional regulator [Prevotellaceae bacterium]